MGPRRQMSHDDVNRSVEPIVRALHTEHATALFPETLPIPTSVANPMERKLLTTNMTIRADSHPRWPCYQCVTSASVGRFKNMVNIGISLFRRASRAPIPTQQRGQISPAVTAGFLFVQAEIFEST